MKKLKNLLTEHRKASVVALCLLLLFVCGSALSAVHVAQERSSSPTLPVTPEEAHESSDGSSQDASAPPLTESQSEAINDYDDDTKTLIQTLSASVWSVSEGRYTLRFYDDSYVETVNGEPEAHSYAITRVEKSSDGYGGSIYTIVFETDTGTHIVTYVDGKGAGANAQATGGTSAIISSLTSSSMFSQKNTAYERADAVESISVKGLSSDASQLLGGDASPLVPALSKWCAVHYPSATEATWNQVVNIDYGSGIVTTGFALNGQNPVNITAVFEQSTGDFSFDG